MSGIRAQRIEHVAIDVTDVARAKAFYGGVLGLKEILRPESFTFGGAWYQVGPEVLHLVSRPESIPEAPHHFCLWVADVHDAARMVETAGYAVVWDTRYKIPGVDRFFTRDPDGNRVEFQGDDRKSRESEPGSQR
ncbi:MAG: bleomycin resistance protein [Phycisphaerales bacterium]|nr:bleomycin resistance protein [Phycisphaerales bacterium]